MRKASKRRLADTLYQLGSQQPIDRITVQLITQKAGLSHPTFYNHFRDKNDLLYWMYGETYENWRSDLRPGGLKTLITQAVSEVASHKDFAINLADYSEKDVSFLDYAVRFDTEEAIKYLEKTFKHPVCARLKAQIELFCTGAIYLTVQWLKDEVDLDQKELAETILDAMPPTLKTALETNGYPPVEKE